MVCLPCRDQSLQTRKQDIMREVDVADFFIILVSSVHRHLFTPSEASINETSYTVVVLEGRIWQNITILELTKEIYKNS